MEIFLFSVYGAVVLSIHFTAASEVEYSTVRILNVAFHAFCPENKHTHWTGGIS